LTSQLEWKHRIHGQPRHDLCIYIAERALVRNGHLLMDGTWMGSKGYKKGLPDIYVRVYDQRKDTHGATTPVWQDYVIEIESKLTKANRIKKYDQFRATVKGIELVIINLAECPGNPYSMVDMELFICSQLPCVDQPTRASLLKAGEIA
jgi:hypothetical protein